MTNVAETDATAISDELKPCPFCGSRDISADGPSYCQPMCNGCGAHVYEQEGHAEAITAWNRRYTLPSSVTDEQVEALKAALAAVNKAGGTCLGVAMSGKDHPDPDGALMEVFEVCNAASKTVSAALSAAALPPSRDDAVGVRVKALKWGKTSYGTPEAQSVAGVYRITNAWDGGFNVNRGSVSLQDEDGRKNFPSLEAAQAAAFADFKQRILSALEPAQQPIGRATVIEECAKVAEGKAAQYAERKARVGEQNERAYQTADHCMDAATNIASDIRALTDKEPTNG